MMPARCRPRPTGARPCATLARQRPSSMPAAGPFDRCELVVTRCRTRSGVRRRPSGTNGSRTSTRSHGPWTRGRRLRRHRGPRTAGSSDLARRSRSPDTPAVESRGGRSDDVRPTKIRNVALVGHGGAGKTTLAEALLFAAGAIPRMGRVEDGTTVYDFDPEEQRRRISVSLALAPFECDGHKVNLVDTPGLRRLRRRRRRGAAGGRPRGVRRVARSRASRSRPRSPGSWPRQRGMPRVIFVNKLDRERASFERTLDQLKDRFGAGVAPLELPIGEEAEFRGRRRPAHRRGRAPTTAPARAPTGRSRTRWRPRSTRSTTRSIEGIVVADDDLMERYLGDETIEVEELEHALAKGIDEATRVPGALRQRDASSIGVDRLAHFIVEEGPAPASRPTAPPAAFVFKTIVDPYVGRVNLFKVLQGTVKTDDHARQRPHRHRRAAPPAHHDARQGAGRRSREVPAGDIAAVAKLDRHDDRRRARRRGRRARRRAARAARARCSRPRSRPRPRATRTSSPTRCTACRTRTRRCASSATRRPTRRCCGAWARPTSAIALERLERKFGVEVETEDVKVPYRETITGTGRGRGQVQEADRWPRPVRRSRSCASSRSSAARASSSSTRSSAA